MKNLIDNHNLLFTAFMNSNGIIQTELSMNIDLEELFGEDEFNHFEEKIGRGLTEQICQSETICNLLTRENCLFADFMIFGFIHNQKEVKTVLEPGVLTVIPLKKNVSKEKMNDSLIKTFQTGKV